MERQVYRRLWYRMARPALAKRRTQSTFSAASAVNGLNAIDGVGGKEAVCGNRNVCTLGGDGATMLGKSGQGSFEAQYGAASAESASSPAAATEAAATNVGLPANAAIATLNGSSADAAHYRHEPVASCDEGRGARRCPPKRAFDAAGTAATMGENSSTRQNVPTPNSAVVGDASLSDLGPALPAVRVALTSLAIDLPSHHGIGLASDHPVGDPVGDPAGDPSIIPSDAVSTTPARVRLVKKQIHWQRSNRARPRRAHLLFPESRVRRPRGARLQEFPLKHAAIWAGM